METQIYSISLPIYRFSQQQIEQICTIDFSKDQGLAGVFCDIIAQFFIQQGQKKLLSEKLSHLIGKESLDKAIDAGLEPIAGSYAFREIFLWAVANSIFFLKNAVEISVPAGLEERYATIFALLDSLGTPDDVAVSPCSPVDAVSTEQNIRTAQVINQSTLPKSQITEKLGAVAEDFKYDAKESITTKDAASSVKHWKIGRLVDKDKKVNGYSYEFKHSIFELIDNNLDYFFGHLLCQQLLAYFVYWFYYRNAGYHKWSDWKPTSQQQIYDDLKELKENCFNYDYSLTSLIQGEKSEHHQYLQRFVTLIHFVEQRQTNSDFIFGGTLVEKQDAGLKISFAVPESLAAIGELQNKVVTGINGATSFLAKFTLASYLPPDYPYDESSYLSYQNPDSSPPCASVGIRIADIKGKQKRIRDDQSIFYQPYHDTICQSKGMLSIDVFFKISVELSRLKSDCSKHLGTQTILDLLTSHCKSFMDVLSARHHLEKNESKNTSSQTKHQEAIDLDILIKLGDLANNTADIITDSQAQDSFLAWLKYKIRTSEFSIVDGSNLAIATFTLFRTMSFSRMYLNYLDMEFANKSQLELIKNQYYQKIQSKGVNAQFFWVSLFFLAELIASFQLSLKKALVHFGNLLRAYKIDLDAQEFFVNVSEVQFLILSLMHDAIRDDQLMLNFYHWFLPEKMSIFFELVDANCFDSSSILECLTYISKNCIPCSFPNVPQQFVAETRADRDKILSWINENNHPPRIIFSESNSLAHGAAEEKECRI